MIDVHVFALYYLNQPINYAWPLPITSGHPRQEGLSASVRSRPALSISTICISIWKVIYTDKSILGPLKSNAILKLCLISYSTNDIYLTGMYAFKGYYLVLMLPLPALGRYLHLPTIANSLWSLQNMVSEAYCSGQLRSSNISPTWLWLHHPL